MYSKDDSVGLPHGFRLDNLSMPDACKSQNWFCAHAISAFLQGLFEVINEKRQSWHLGLRAYWGAFCGFCWKHHHPEHCAHGPASHLAAEALTV